MPSHFQCRFASRIVKHPDGQKVITFSDHELGRMYPLHGQKTLRSYQAKAPTLDAALLVAKELNLGKNLPPRAIGVVIVQHKYSRGLTICGGSAVGQHPRRTPREKDTTEWQLFVNSKGETFKLDPKKHIIHP